MRLRFGKCWQYKNEAILFQLAPVGEKDALPSKFFLKVSCQKEGKHYVRFLEKKSALNWEASGAFASLVRKHIPSGVIEGILVDKEQQNVWIPIFNARSFLIHIQQEGAVTIDLLTEDHHSLIRMGVKGVFTKKKTSLVRVPPKSETVDILPLLLSEMAVSPEKTSPLPVEAATTFSFFQREARRRLARRLKTLKGSLQKQETLLLSDEEFQKLQAHAHLLQTYSHKVSAQSHELVLNKTETGAEDIAIALDPTLSLGKNIDAYFRKIKKEKKARELTGKQIAHLEAELEALAGELKKLGELELSEADIIATLQRFHLPLDKPDSPSKKPMESLPYRVFKSADGFDLLVGKGPRENDELTKSSRSDDFWLHAIGVTGSHVIVRGKKLEKLSPQTKREAAMLALHFSKLRKDEGGDVYITQRRFLTKKKGMPPGLWSIRQSETYSLNYTEEELRAVLGRL